MCSAVYKSVINKGEKLCWARCFCCRWLQMLKSTILITVLVSLQFLRYSLRVQYGTRSTLERWRSLWPFSTLQFAVKWNSRLCELNFSLCGAEQSRKAVRQWENERRDSNDCRWRHRSSVCVWRWRSWSPQA